MTQQSHFSVDSVLVLGGGSAGLLAALSLKRLIPSLEVRLIRSIQLGVIGVGEGTTAAFPEFLFNHLGIPREEFYREARPTWKQGIKFIWGPRDQFFYDFEFQYDHRFDGLPKANGYYAHDDCSDFSQACALMQRGKAFPTGALGRPVVKGSYAFHIENHHLVTYLESAAGRAGVVLEDDVFIRAETGPAGIEALHFEKSGRRTADLYVDASGFKAELLGKALGEGFKSFEGGLFCDRAMTGGWEREDEPIQAYTTAETMDHGWCWQIEHEGHINRGYVYSSRFASEDEVREEFLRKNPRVTRTRVLEFRSGRRERGWVGNVVAVGNASGFVEPLEATALAQILFECRWLQELIELSGRRPGPHEREFFNHAVGVAWDEIRDFLAFHYRFNTRLDTPFWRHCRDHTDLGDYQAFFDLYQEIGPSPMLAQMLPNRPNIYGIEGFLAMLVGMQVPHGNPHHVTTAEIAALQAGKKHYARRAASGLNVAETLAAIRRPSWQWS